MSPSVDISSPYNEEYMAFPSDDASSDDAVLQEEDNWDDIPMTPALLSDHPIAVPVQAISQELVEGVAGSASKDPLDKIDTSNPSTRVPFVDPTRLTESSTTESPSPYLPFPDANHIQVFSSEIVDYSFSTETFQGALQDGSLDSVSYEATASSIEDVYWRHHNDYESQAVLQPDEVEIIYNALEQEGWEVYQYYSTIIRLLLNTIESDPLPVTFPVNVSLRVAPTSILRAAFFIGRPHGARTFPSCSVLVVINLSL